MKNSVFMLNFLWRKNMKNIGIQWVKNANIDNFTSSFGIKFRQMINPLLRKLLNLVCPKPIIVEADFALPLKNPYIFVCTHYFIEDIISCLATIDRNVYLLCGTTNQIENNRQMYISWLNGLIYVNRNNKDNRHDSINKMERILYSGSSILIYPEGGWNNTENILVQRLFAGPYILSSKTQTSVVPMSIYNDEIEDKIYVKFGEPIELFKYEKEFALETLRDVMSALLWSQIEKHSDLLKRSELDSDIHMQHMLKRRSEYLKVKWTKDVWDEELTVYKPKNIADFEDVYSFLDNIEFTPQNAGILANLYVELQERRKYNLKSFMKDTWNIKLNGE